MTLLIINSLTFLVIIAYASSSDLFQPKHAESTATKTSLPTVTVRGFLNFRTTVDGTVIVFTPASAASESQSSILVQSSNYETTKNTAEIKPTSAFENVKITPTSTGPLETKPQYPTGLVTVLGGTVVLNGATTVYETKVIGTYISGKYAQILKSTSHIKDNAEISSTLSSIQPSKPFSSFEMPKATPQVNLFSSQNFQFESQKPELFTSKLIISDSNNKNGLLINRQKDNITLKNEDSLNKLKLIRFNNKNTNNNNSNNNHHNPNDNKEESSESDKIKIQRPSRIGSRRLTYTPRQLPRVRLNRFKVKIPTGREKVEEEAAKEINQRFQKRLGINKPSQSLKSREESKEESQDSAATENENPAYLTPDHNSSPKETIEPRKVLKQVQTITSEITQHLNGNKIKEDSITLTTTVDDTLHPSARLLNSEIVAPTIPTDGNDLDAISVQETPPIVISRTYSMTDRISRTTVIPVFDGSSTTNHTVTESFVIRKLITAYKTMPPGDLLLLETAAFDINNSIFLNNNIESSETNIEPSIFQGNIEMTGLPDENLIQKTTQTSNSYQTIDPSLAFPTASPFLPNIDLNNPLILNAALRNPALAAMYFGLQNLQNQQPSKQYGTVIKPTEVVTTETVYNTKTISFYDGRATRTRTITEPGSIIEKTTTSYTTEMSPILNSQLFLQQAQLQRIFATQLLNPVGLNLNPATLNINPGLGAFNPPSTIVTSTFSTVTSATSTSTKVYTLKYNAFSTKYRTVTSTSIYPTTMILVTTTTITNTFPSAFNPFFG